MSTSTGNQSPPMASWQLFHWLIRCDACGLIDHTHDLGDFAYGVALGRTCSNELTVFSAWEDPVYEELIEIVRTFVGDSNATLVDCLFRIMGLAIDPPPSGERYKFIDRLCCRRCGAMARLHQVGDPPKETVSVFVPTHHEWQRLSREEKMKTIEAGERAPGGVE